LPNSDQYQHSKANVFCFEKFWAERNDFVQTVEDCWFATASTMDSACTISAKFKALRAKLKD
jgi:hypothetical protein